MLKTKVHWVMDPASHAAGKMRDQPSIADKIPATATDQNVLGGRENSASNKETHLRSELA